MEWAVLLKQFKALKQRYMLAKRSRVSRKFSVVQANSGQWGKRNR